MKKILKFALFSCLGIFLLLVISAGLFFYKVKFGFNTYETEAPELPSDLAGNTVLLFSKTNAFRHGEAIEASIPAFEKMAKDNGWSLFVSDNGAVFNTEQLSAFEVVIWNNTSGKVLNEEQRQAFKAYLEGGGGFVGIHAAGDNSHQWDWYQDKVIGAKFSHHTMNPQFQQATMHLESAIPLLTQGLPSSWTREEEWYMFYNNPRENDCRILYTVDESNMNPSGNLPLLASDKDWGMGDDHPIVWYRSVGQGRALYSALGHRGSAFEEPEHLQMLENAIAWAGRFAGD